MTLEKTIDTSKPHVRPYAQRYSGIIYDKDDKQVGVFNFQEELLDFRLQVAYSQIDGYYCVFDFDETQTKCKLDLGGGIENHPRITPSNTINQYTRAIYNFQLNDGANTWVGSPPPQYY